MPRPWLALAVGLVAGCAASADPPAGARLPSGSGGSGGDGAGNGGSFVVDPGCNLNTCRDPCTCPDNGGERCPPGEVGWCDGWVCSLSNEPCECVIADDCAMEPVCYPCPDGTTLCPAAICADHACSLPEPDCGPSPGYDPCAGKVCHDSCTLCDPALTSCVEPPGERRCTVDGVLSCHLGAGWCGGE